MGSTASARMPPANHRDISLVRPTTRLDAVRIISSSWDMIIDKNQPPLQFLLEKQTSRKRNPNEKDKKFKSAKSWFIFLFFDKFQLKVLVCTLRCVVVV